jgi:hypothetical protein
MVRVESVPGRRKIGGEDLFEKIVVMVECVVVVIVLDLILERNGNFRRRRRRRVEERVKRLHFSATRLHEERKEGACVCGS